MHNYTIAELRKMLDTKKISSVELTHHYLKRIHQYQSSLNAFVTICDETALKQAADADKRIQEGRIEALTGIPMAQKDIFCTQGIKTTCGSKMLDNFIAPYESTVTQKFLDAGSVMLGKTNMDEFAMGSSNETSFYGAVKNPWDLECVPGGSSGGASAAMAAQLAAGATGTDTGGSIRQPAALTGISGIKPTYGSVSRYGMIAFASSLDQAGPMGKTAEDLALMLNTMAGFDPKDSTSIDRAKIDYTALLNQPLKGLRIGIPKTFFDERLDKQMAEVIQTAIKVFESQGATLHDIELPHNDVATAAYYVIAPAECSSNLSRYDGVRYGYRCDNPKNLLDLYQRSRAEGFGTEVKQRIMVGTYALSSKSYEACYLKAQKIRRLIRRDFLTAFENVDVIMGPTSPTTAFKIGERCQDPIQMYLSDMYTIAVNLAGLPGMSIPAGLINNMPVGLQIIGNYFDEARMLGVAHQYQLLTDWHKKVPENFK
ncbi:MAG: Asp-tRNA(Asn)/Glu-tRNA(Gln) amidotransferase subunit GatA [Pseudomonadota bacterium]